MTDDLIRAALRERASAKRAIRDADTVLETAKRELLPKIACPLCGAYQSRVKNSRPDVRGRWILRRRECADCHERFNTRETAVPLQKTSVPHNM